jgi:transposase InsO family protein
MARLQRQPIEPTDDWRQLQLLTQFPEQLGYELLRPVVLFGLSPAERARQTNAPQRTLYRQVARFEAEGMASLFAPSREQRRQLPAEIRQAIVALKAEYPPLRPHQIATICEVRFGRRPSARTIKRALTEASLPAAINRRYPPYHQMPEAADRRLAIIRLHSEGWTNQNIAGYLDINRDTVLVTLRRWIEEGVYGLDDKSHARKPGVRKVDLQTIALVRELQENPELGEFRIHAALKQLGIELSPRTCGRILARNRQLYGLPKPSRGRKEPKTMPFRAHRRHQYWTVDIRYLDHGIDDERVYCISILENYSRAVLASAVSRRQNLTAYLMVLYAAIRQHGAPEALVSDGGSVFRAKQARQIYDALGIKKLEIERRQPWQSYIETQFNVQRRIADWHFLQAANWADLKAAHDRWVVDFNYQSHWAHRHREDSRHSPAEVLGWVSGRQFTPDEVHRAFYTTRFGRRLNRAGYLRFRHWRLYGERGLAGEQAAVWLYGEQLTVAFADEALAEYQVTYQPGGRQFTTIVEEELFETPYRSPQLSFWEHDQVEWLTVIRVPPYVLRQRPLSLNNSQLRLFPEHQSALS